MPFEEADKASETTYVALDNNLLLMFLAVCVLEGANGLLQWREVTGVTVPGPVVTSTVCCAHEYSRKWTEQ